LTPLQYSTSAVQLQSGYRSVCHPINPLYIAEDGTCSIDSTESTSGGVLRRRYERTGGLHGVIDALWVEVLWTGRSAPIMQSTTCDQAYVRVWSITWPICVSKASQTDTPLAASQHLADRLQSLLCWNVRLCSGWTAATARQRLFVSQRATIRKLTDSLSRRRRRRRRPLYVTRCR